LFIRNKNMKEISKEELLKRSKWIRFIFMAIYASVLYLAVLPITLILIIIQFIFHLFFGSPSNQIKKLTDWFVNFFKVALDFLTYHSEEKPFPFDEESIIENDTSGIDQIESSIDDTSNEDVERS
tara:strand:- start:227 stop:601 length:375 start_codon:yes stop_codon:yes gene_type:complete